MIGDREQIEAIPLRLSGQPCGISCPADINAIPAPNPQPNNTLRSGIMTFLSDRRSQGYSAPTVRAADAVKPVTVAKTIRRSEDLCIGGVVVGVAREFEVSARTGGKRGVCDGRDV